MDIWVSEREKEMKRGRVMNLNGVNGDFLLKEYQVPGVKEGTLLCKVDLCGVCGTDGHTYLGHFANTPFPLLLGHEISATIIELGKGCLLYTSDAADE